MSDVISGREALCGVLSKLGKVGVMYSGGLDSTVLCHLAREVLGSDVLALTVDSPLLPRVELVEASEAISALGMQHEIVPLNELSDERFRANLPDRCYLCRRMRDETLRRRATALGVTTLIDGMNADDLDDYRPGLRAADEDGIRHLFIEQGWGRRQIQECARDLGIERWNRPSTVGLCSRVAYGRELSMELLQRIEAAEEIVHGLGIDDVRVRVVEEYTALVETDEFGLVLAHRDYLAKMFRSLGFALVALDLEGREGGRMNRLLDSDERQCKL